MATTRSTLQQGDEPARPDFENGSAGTGNEARLAQYEQIADHTDQLRADDMTEVQDTDYDYMPDDEAAEEFKPEREAPEQTTPAAPGSEPARRFHLKVNGVDLDLDEAEVIARAQKVTAADQYLAEASNIYHNAKQSQAAPPPPVAAIDSRALARALQMGSEDEAEQAVQALVGRQSLSEDEIVRRVDQRLAEHTAINRDLEKFRQEYHDALADEDVRTMIFDLDSSYALQGEPATYARYQKAAERTLKLSGRNPATLAAKLERKASVKPVTGASGRQPPPAEERELTTREIIAQQAQARGQAVLHAGN